MTTVKKCANRKFCTFAEDYPFKNGKCRPTAGKLADFTKLLKYIDENIVGRNVTFLGPFGRRKVVYCDYTASGRALQFIEDYVLKEILPLYANTHTSSNVTAVQTTLYRQEARDIIRNAVHASENDAVIFAGNGCTGALHKLIHALDLEEPPIVFVGSNEHRLVLLPWKEIGAKIVRIAETKEGFLDLIDLENKLQKEKQLLNSLGSRAQFIGCFPAASNITGILADDIATTVLLHQYGALSFWDYATAAPYVPLDMNPLLPGNDKGVHKDAIFFSGHKFIGGVQSPGVLIAKRQLFRNEIPEGNGRRALFPLSGYDYKYLQDIEVREEGETESTINSIRMGLTMHLKQTLGAPNILLREQKITKTVLSFLRTIPEIILLGNGSRSVKRLPIFSFVVRHPRGVFLHHNFICSVLNDVFGIQARGGRACAEPYAYDLLGINEKLASAYEEVLVEDERLDCHRLRHHEEHSSYEMLRPGFIRISLPYFMSDADVSYVLEAVKMVATEGWKLLPQYILYPEGGEWKHRTSLVFRDRKWLSSFRFIDGKMTTNERKISGQSPFPQDPADCLQMARNIFNKARKMAHRFPLTDQRVMLDEKADKLRWFMLPSEAQDLLLGNCQKVKTQVPFSPGEYSGTRNNSISEDSMDSLTVPVCSTPLSLDLSSSLYTRHNSLTSFETSPLKRSSSFLNEKSCSDSDCISPFHSFNKEVLPKSRTRCYSLESSSASPPSRLLSSIENGHCSCGSQTDISDAESISKDGHVSADFSDFSDMGITTLFPAQENENIQAYVKGVTEELATEIKTEIREVIATVDNVLSESIENLDSTSSYEKRYSPDFRRTNSIPFSTKNSSNSCVVTSQSYNEKCSYFPNQLVAASNYGTENGRMNGIRQRVLNYESQSYPPISCQESRKNVSDHVAVYLAELTTEMVTEMKSELREMVNAVDEIISPSIGDKTHCSGFESTGRNRTVSLTVKEEWEDSDDSQSQNDNSFKKCKTDVVIKEIKSKDLETEETKSLTKSDSSSDSGVAEICSKESPTKVSKRKISVVARESKSSPNVKEEIASEVKLEKSELFEIDKNDLDRRKRSFETITFQPKWHCPPKTVWKPTVEAIREFDMIREGDRILLCLSGGKDSLSLLHTLHQYQYYSQSYGVTFTFGAVTVDPENSSYDPRPLIPYLHALGVNYLYEEQKIIEKTEEVDCSSICSFCSRLKRGRLYETAKDNNYNVLALGQHLDDLAESLLMSTFHNGRLRSMKAHYYIRERDLRVIRPFVYVREKHLKQFAENRKLPVVVENYSTCLEASKLLAFKSGKNSELDVCKERHRTKQLLAQQEILHPKLFVNLKSALQPLISFRQVGDENNMYKKKKHTEDTDGTNYGGSDTEEEDPNEIRVQFQ